MRKWSGKIKDLRGWSSDWLDDFCATVNEVAGRRTLPQILGVVFVVFVFAGLAVVMWAVLSLLLGLLVWLLWNQVMPDLGVPAIGYWNAYCLALLCAILFRGNSVHLHETKG